MIEPDAALALILSAVNDITFLPAMAAIVVMLTSISKRYILNVRSEILALFWQVLGWVLWVVVKEFRFDMNQFDLFITAFATILTGVVGAVASQAIATPWLYNKARTLNAPMLSYERPKQLMPAEVGEKLVETLTKKMAESSNPL